MPSEIRPLRDTLKMILFMTSGMVVTEDLEKMDSEMIDWLMIDAVIDCLTTDCVTIDLLGLLARFGHRENLFGI